MQGTHSSSYTESPLCRRLDMTTPMAIFGGLFIAAATFAICGTLEARAPAVTIKETVAVHQENVVGPADLNLVSSCREQKSASGLAELKQQCSTTVVRTTGRSSVQSSR